jgi:hypothetical protein
MALNQLSVRSNQSSKPHAAFVVAVIKFVCLAFIYLFSNIGLHAIGVARSLPCSVRVDEISVHDSINWR